MAEKVALKAKLREERGKGAARRRRQAGEVPAVIYGHGIETKALTLDALELERLFSNIAVESTLIDVKIEGQRRAVRALVREVQSHPYKPEILHVDLYQVRADEAVHVEIPVRVTGTAAGVKEGGVLQHALYDLPVRCLPDAIPDAFEVDISALEIGDSVHVRDIPVPEGVTFEIDPDRTVASVVPPTVVAVEEEEPEVPEELAEEVEPELIRERPEEEEEPPATEQG
jgi:large subunit ribosomal protein L25